MLSARLDLTHPDLALERLDYSRIGARWAVVRLTARLRTDVGLPADPRLVIDHANAQGPYLYPGRACRVVRRLERAGGGDGALLWRAAFAVPAKIVEHPDAAFALGDGDKLLLALPAPARRTMRRRSPQLRPAPAPRPGLLAPGRLRRRAVAVAAVAALTTTSTPAVALASTADSSSSSSSADAGASGSASTTSVAATAPTAPSTETVAAEPTDTTPATTTPATTTTTTPATVTTAAPSTTTPAPASTASAPPPTGTSAAAAAHHSSTSRDEARVAADRRAAILAAGVRQASAVERAAAAEQAVAQASAVLLPHTSAAADAGSSDTSRSSAAASAPALIPAPGFSAPASWTGTVAADPALTGVVRNLAGLLANGNRPPSFLIPIYLQAARQYHLPWEVLAAINAIESDYGRDLNTSSAGAVGWMQFEPSTWNRYGLAADGHSTPNPYDPRDAIFSAARYLQAAGGSDDIRRAVFAYNHAGWYVDEVMQRAQAIAEHAQFEKQTVGRHGTVSVYFATGLKGRPRVRYRGGVMSHYDRLVSAANMVSAADFPYLWGGGHEQPARFGPFDCSGSVSYVMQQAGYRVPTTVSGDIAAWRLPAGPGQVTIFYNPTHTFMRIGHRFFGTSGFARPGGGAGWFDVDKLSAGYLSQFSEVHVPRLGSNSFSADPRLLQLHALRRERELAGVRRLARERASTSWRRRI